MSYIIYGKRTIGIINPQNGKMLGPDKRFAALDKNGIRVSKLTDACFYETREAAQEIIDRKSGKEGVIFEIRKAK